MATYTLKIEQNKLTLVNTYFIVNIKTNAIQSVWSSYEIAHRTVRHLNVMKGRI